MVLASPVSPDCGGGGTLALGRYKVDTDAMSHSQWWKSTDTPAVRDMLWLRVRAWWRRLGVTTALAAVVIGVVAGTAMGLATGVRRTASAPDRYTDAAGGDLDLFLFQPDGAPLTEAVGALDGVSESASWTFVSAFPMGDDGALEFDLNPFAGNDRVGGVRLVAGRFTDPASPNEFTANRSFAALLAATPGDRFQFAAYDQPQVDGNEFDRGIGLAVPPFEATLVGVTEAASDFDDPTAALVFSEAFLAAHPDVGLVASLIGVWLDPGADPSAVLAAVRSLPGGERIFTGPPRIVSEDARRAVGVQVSALWLVTAVAVVVSAVVIAQLARRILGPTRAERSSLLALGSGSSAFRSEVFVEAALLTVWAAPAAVVTCLAVSAAFPLGVLGLFEPNPGVRADPYVLLAAPLITLIIIGGAGISAVQRRKDHQPAQRSRSSVSLIAARSAASLPLTIGSKLAAEGSSAARGGGRAVLLGGMCIAGLVASGIVGISLYDATNQPARWGATYDQLYGNQFVAAPGDLAGPVADDPDLAALTTATIESIPIDGLDVSIFATEQVRGEFGLVLLEGSPPEAPDEIGLGRETMRKLKVGVGDTVSAVADDGNTRLLHVVGISVSPDTAGGGAWMTFAGVQSLRPTATKNLLLVDFRPGASAETVERVAGQTFSPPGALTAPTSVKALERVIPAPFMLAVVLALLLIVATSYRLALSVRSQRHDLTVLRALGAKPGQLRRAVHWHATLISLAASAIGVPLGIIAGRWVMSLITDSIGIVPGATVPVVALAGVCAAVILVANAIAVLPADRAARPGMPALLADASSQALLR